MTLFDEVNNIKVVIDDDFMETVSIDGKKLGPRSSVLRDVKKVNHHAGYVVMRDGTIRCAVEANHNIAQYDFCHESSISL